MLQGTNTTKVRSILHVELVRFTATDPISDGLGLKRFMEHAPLMYPVPYNFQPSVNNKVAMRQFSKYKRCNSEFGKKVFKKCAIRQSTSIHYDLTSNPSRLSC